MRFTVSCASWRSVHAAAKRYRRIQKYESLIEARRAAFQSSSSVTRVLADDHTGAGAGDASEDDDKADNEKGKETGVDG